MHIRGLSVAFLALAVARPAFAQFPAARITTQTYVAINPLLIPFNIGSFEVESGVAPGVTLGGVASYTEADDKRWTSFDAKVRYYPSEVVLRGFSVGLTGGFLKYSDRVGPEGQRETMNAGTIGIVTDFNWLLGPSRRFVVGTGIGVKRVLASKEERDRVNIDRAYATGRFIIGYGF
jgi:hypothetical protein